MSFPRVSGKLTIRMRVSLVFAVVLATVLAGTGLFLNLRFTAEMNNAINQGLRSRAGDVITLVREADSGLRNARPTALNNRARGFAQILTTSGAIFDASPPAGSLAVLSPSELATARPAGRFFERASIAELRGEVRLFAVPVNAQGRNLVVVVGTSLADLDTAIRNLRALLLFGGAGALLLSALAGYLAVAAALRPIELIRRRAEEITAVEPGARLPVAPTGDEVARLGGTLNSMLERLEEALRHERTFVSDASHELRTPLAILRAEFELALRSPQTREALEQTIRSAAEETRRMTQLAEALLVIARGEQGQLQLSFAQVDAGELLRKVRDRFARRAQLEGRAISVSAAVQSNLRADPARLEQALSSMIENALLHARGDITLSTFTANGCVELHVSDCGEGFQPEFLPHAFERFAREDVGRTGQGSGLGLAIVTTIAKAHNGSAHAANRLHGADVWLSLPVRR